MNRVLGGSVVGALCCLAFLGIEYWRIPNTVKDVVDKRIDEDAIKRIGQAKALADSLLSTEAHGWDKDERQGFVVVGDTQICYGTHDTTKASLASERHFQFRFLRAFASPPSVTVTAKCKSDERSFGIRYEYDPTETGHRGVLTEVGRGEAGNQSNSKDGAIGAIPVEVSYIAIGQSVKDGFVGRAKQ